jgi:hypothetical protein
MIFMYKGKCPLCGSYMRNFRNHYWRDKELTFPYDIFRCVKHGIYIWHQNRHELADFNILQHEARVKPLPKDADVQWFDPTIVNMKCPVCDKEWKQYMEFPSEAYGGVVFCPNGHSVKREEALQRNTN